MDKGYLLIKCPGPDCKNYTLAQYVGWEEDATETDSGLNYFYFPACMSVKELRQFIDWLEEGYGKIVRGEPCPDVPESFRKAFNGENNNHPPTKDGG